MKKSTVLRRAGLDLQIFGFWPHPGADGWWGGRHGTLRAECAPQILLGHCLINWNFLSEPFRCAASVLQAGSAAGVTDSVRPMGCSFPRC